MKTLTGGDIRREFLILQETVSKLNEKFVKESDPSVSVLDFNETVTGALRVIKSEYNRMADDRNKVITSVLAEVGVIEGACSKLRGSLNKIKSGEEEPEDTNKEIGG